MFDAAVGTADGPRSLVIQSILYGTAERDVIRSAKAVASAAMKARNAGLLSEWELAFGDCSDGRLLDTPATDAIDEIVRRSAGSSRYIHFAENLGHGGGHNRLAAGGSSDLLLFLNPDSVLAPDALVQQLLALSEGVGAVDARQLPFEHPKDFDIRTGETSWASGSCLMTRRAVFDEVGGFDDDSFFLYCDDVDYSWRVRLAGYSVVHEPSARLFHDKRFSVDGEIGTSAAERYYSAEAAVMLALKYSRRDIAVSILTAFENSSDDNLRRAWAEIRRREASGRLPSPLDPDGRVAQFVDGNYAKHRF